MIADGDRLARIALGHLVEPGSRELGALVRGIGAAAALARLLDGGVSERLAGAVATRLAAGRVQVAAGAALATKLQSAAGLAEAALRQADRLGARILTPGDADWPAQLSHLARISREGNGPVDRDTDPPLILWARGPARLDEALDRSVAIVGARAATGYGHHVATDLAYGLAERGWTVVSGGAFGIDAAAHRAALHAGGGTAAVLACGIDRPYPLAHTSLFERIAEDGLLLSEWPPEAAPHRQRFLTRNRVIAALTRGTVVVEAAARSGARQTLGRARRLGRPAMVVPGPVTSALSAGCHAELRDFECRVVTSVAEVIEEVGRIGELAPTSRGPDRPHDALDPLAARVLDAVLPRRVRTAEEIAVAAGVSGRDARRTLPMLESVGFVVAHGDGYRLGRPR